MPGYIRYMVLKRKNFIQSDTEVFVGVQLVYVTETHFSGLTEMIQRKAQISKLFKYS